MTLAVVKRTSLRAVLARRLREVAAEHGVALTHVADRAGVGRSHLWRLLNDEASATLDVVEKLAEALEVEPLALLGGSSLALGAPSVERPRRARVERVTAEPKRRPWKRG